MSKDFTITPAYFKQYRLRIGFTNQDAAEDFLAAKDIIPKIDLPYIKALNKRLCEIVDRVNGILPNEIKMENIASFKKERIDRAFSIMRKSGILRNLNNYGRRPEQVYFNWMRGYVVQYLFSEAVGLIFGIDLADVSLIGDDELKTAKTFVRAPTADLELHLKNGKKIRVEMQAGFTGINDIKQHKVLEAKRVLREAKVPSLAIHFDIYNGQVAFVRLDEIEEKNMNWITRQQLEGQTVFNINQNYFIWKLTEPPPKYEEISFD